MRNNGRTLTAELEEMEVYGETRVGWDENTPINETVDAQGNLCPGERGFGVADPNSPKCRVYDDPEVEALRGKLRERNGIRGLEICEPHETKKIARIFHRDGFCVVERPAHTGAARALERWMRRSTP